MPNFETVPLRRHLISHRRALLQGASLGALLLVPTQGRTAAPFQSINQALALASHAAVASMAPAAGVTAAKQAQLGAQNLATAAARFRSLSNALTAAANAANAQVADGLAPGGLEVLSGADGKTPAAYTGATPPSQATGTYNVTIKQTQALAQLAWKTFNIGAKTHLTFDQTSGGAQASSWIAINSVQDPLANPTQILGSISAVGKVYILNRNGIAFGTGATINVGSLIAATADIASSQLSHDANGLPIFSLYGAQQANTATYLPTFVNGIATRTVTVAPGASLQAAPASGTTSGGYVYLFGGNVTNAGLIGTPQGQTVLAAGTEFTLRQGSQGSTTTGNTTSTTIGSEVAALNTPVLTFDQTIASFPSGSVLNTGVVVADQGDISLVGHAITQGGVLFSTTTVNTRGTIHLLTSTAPPDPASTTDPLGLDSSFSSVTLAPDSVTEIIPEDNGATALDSQRAANIAASATLNALRATTAMASSTNPLLNNHSTLPDQFGESRIEISGGGTADLQPGAIAIAPGGQVAIGAAGRILVETGAAIDVSGSTSAVLPSSVNDILVNVQPYQLRDSAANRDGGLKSTNVYVDARTLVEIASGAYGPTTANPLGNIYTPGGLFEVGGYLGLVPHGITEWTAIGGQVTLQSTGQPSLVPPVPGQMPPPPVNGEVITQPGSIINLTGGTVTYAAGPVHATYVQSTDGVIYNANTAPGNLVYTGLYTGDVFAEPRWRISENFVNPLLTPSTTLDPSYVVGRDAGTLTVSAPTAILQGSAPGGVTLGQDQTAARPPVVSDPYLLAQNVVPLAGALQIGDYASGTLTNGYATAVLFESTPGIVAPSSIGDTLAAGLANTATIDAGQLNADGFARLTVTTIGDITIAAPVSIADGGSISFAASTIEANAGISARGGAITLTNGLTVGGSTTPIIAPIPPSTTGTSTTGTSTSGTSTSGTSTSGTGTVAVPPPDNIVLATGATLDARGVWTNAAQDPVHVAGEALVNGGTVTIDGVGGVNLQAGGRIDVSSGGAILPGGRTLSGAGGNITVIADLSPTAIAQSGGQPVTFDSTFVGYGSRGAGTLSLTAPDFRIGTTDHTGLAPDVVVIGATLFQSGFGAYALDGTKALSVLPGAQITVAEPIYVPLDGLAVPTGGDPSQAYAIVLPPLFTPVRGGDTATQRAGASISLSSDFTPTSALGGGPVTIGAGASVTVDPRQSITIAGNERITVFGTLTAHAGTVEVANTRFDTAAAGLGSPAEYVPGLSVWIDGSSVIDVSGQASLFTDPLGRRFGSVSAGGTIELGGYGGLANPQSTWAQVIVRPGAVLDASGATAAVDLVPGDIAGSFPPSTAPVTLVSNGGTVIARSLAGVALDGTVIADAGGAGAAGGALYLRVDPINLAAFSNIPIGLYQPSQVLVTQDFVPVQAAGLAYDQITPDSTFGLARISQAQIDAGGFDRVSLYGADFVAFDGSVALHTAASLTLAGDIVGATSNAVAASVTAPYVLVAGLAGSGSDMRTSPSPNTVSTTASLTIQADLLDLQDAVSLGGTINLGSPSTITGGSSGIPAVMADSFGFGEVTFASTGDIRFLGSTGNETAGVKSQGNLVFRAAQLYPVTGQSSVVYAGLDPAATSGDTLLGGTLTVQGLGGAPPPAPYSVGGGLALVADTVVQDGVVRAPQGQIRLGFDQTSDSAVAGGATFSTAVFLAAGSVTSVSLLGQTIPYGGTVDGVNYPNPLNPGGGGVGVLDSSLDLSAQSINVLPGASVDLRGGGTLSGAGFVVGRGGSADVLKTPLLNITGGAAIATGLVQTGAVIPANSGDGVYAILPGYQSAYAPATGVPDAGYSTPATGARITVGAQVPGLAAGTYTLLPAYYALQPGGFRVEITNTTLLPGSAVALGNFSVAAPVFTSTANTTAAGVLPVSAIFTSSANVRQLSQYDEESYSTFEATTGTQFGAPRPFLPQDAKTLLLNYPSELPNDPRFLSALHFAAGTLLGTPDPTTGGYGITVEVQGSAPIDIYGPTDLPRPGNIELPALDLSELDASRLVLGGTITVNSSTATLSAMFGTVGVSILPSARLSAGDIMLVTAAGGTLSVLGGATLTTLGAPPAAYDLSSGFYFTSETPVLDVSNGQDVFVPPLSANAAGTAITIGRGASLLAGGSLGFIAPTGTSVGIGTATLQAKYTNIQVGIINAGTLPAGSGTALPPGFALTQPVLATLLPASTTTAASVLTLTATQAVNLVGADASLDTGLAALVLNTPAIYGFGGPADAISIHSATSVTWNGVVFTPPFGPVSSALPGGQIAGSAANDGGALSITAPLVTLGFGPQTQPDGHTQLDRLVAGFASVTLAASQQITANNESTLTVFQAKPDYAAPGTGGDLILDAPLITTAPAAILKLSAGGSLSLISATPAATGTVATLGGEIDLAASAISIDTAVALPAGRLTATADTGIDFGAQARIDLSGRITPIFDQNADSPGGTLVAETGAGAITQEAGSVIDVSAPAAAAGAVSFSALAGSVDLAGSLVGSSANGGQSGSFSVLTGTLPDFAGLNALLDTGGFYASRSFEIATGDLAIAAGSTVTAQKIAIAADAGSIDIAGTLAASGTTPGSITISAGQNLTLDSTGVLDAHATQTAHDSYNQPIDAENRAHVTLTAVAGTLALAGGTIDVSYPGQGVSDVLHPSGNPQGQVVFNAPRLDSTGAANTPAGLTYGDLALSVTGVPTITGAASIALYATGIYQPTDASGTIAQDSTSPFLPPGALGLDQINTDSTAFIGNFNTSFAQRLGGLGSTYGGAFHVRPGVIIESGPSSPTDPTAGDLTITGDLDFSGFRYANGTDYGTPQTGLLGSGEPGSIVFRAANQLIVNGSVSDGFAPPPDSIPGNHLSADAGWVFISGHPDPLGATVILPSSISVTTVTHGVTSITHEVGLEGSANGRGGPASTIAIPGGGGALNYDITIRSTTIAAGNLVPVPIALGADTAPIPAGGWVATAPITDSTGKIVLYAQGALIPQGTILAQGTNLAAGTVLPVDVATQVSLPALAHRAAVPGTFIPAGTPLGSFGALVLSQDTAPLPANALLPAGTTPIFINSAGKVVSELDLRPVQREQVGGHQYQGRLYPLASLLPVGSLSWDLSFVAGANQSGADATAVTPPSVLEGSALAPAPLTLSDAPGSLILDDQHYYKPNAKPLDAAPAFSVIRTGTGDLSLVAGGNFDQSSLYGIYTAGTQTSVAPTADDAFYNTPRNQGGKAGRVLPGSQPDTKVLNRIIGQTPSYYPNDGGDVLVSAQGDITGDGLSVDNSSSATPSDAVGNWLWRQGGTGLGQATAWWVNYGTVADIGTNLELTGFQGIGALGGGNLTVQAGGDAGSVKPGADTNRGHGLIVAVGGTGRVLPDGSLVLTGGGTETVQVGGTLNPINQGGDTYEGDLIDVRGNISLTAGAVGQVTNNYMPNLYDPRALDPFAPTFNTSSGPPFAGGPNLVPGDGTVQVETMRDLVIGGAGDPGRVSEQSFTEVSGTSLFGTGPTTGGNTAFSLWTAATSITLYSSGGNVTPTTQPAEGATLYSSPVVNDAAPDNRIVYPATLLVTAATGSIAYGSVSLTANNQTLGLEAAPSPDGQIAFLAGSSIFGNDFAIDISGAPTAGLSTPFNPTYFVSGLIQGTNTVSSNIRFGGGTNQSVPNALFAQEADTPSGNLHAADTAPALFYAANGDIVDFVSGLTITFGPAAGETLAQWYLAAKPVRIMASQDIVSSGTRPDLAQQGTQQNQQLLPAFVVGGVPVATASGDLFLNTSPQSISVVSAGRDILSGYFYVGGPGTLEVDAGRNLFQAAYTLGSTQVLDFGAIRSLGPLIAGSPISLTGGANLAVLAGIGSSPDYSAFSAAYLDPANQANLALPITDPSNQGKVQLVYTDQLTAWLQANYPALSLANGAYAAFQTLPQIDQDVFVREVFFDETLAGGRQYNDPTSRFFGSYVRGRQAIDTLFPSPAGTETTPGVPFGYTGAITMLSGPVSGLADASGTPLTYDAGISSAFGGTIQVLDPGGQVLLGTAGGPAPGSGSGLITNGTGDIDVYALDSVLLGKSRIFTTAGGNIQVWSSQGDINAGIGARTTIVFTPPILTYDNTGGISETPSVPTNGAGIATLAPLPNVPPGNVDLVAPLGTIDAGEAGIRVSGNLNLAAARLANTANITVAGKTTGNAPPPSVSLGAVEAAGAAAGASTNAAQTTAQPHATQEQPSIVEVEVLGLSGGLNEDEKRRRRGL